MGLDPGRLGALNTKRAHALAASLHDSAPFDETCLDALVGLHGSDGRAYALILDSGSKAFGSLVLWADGLDLDHLMLMIDQSALPGDHARRALALANPPTVMTVDGAALVPAPVSPSELQAAAPSGVDAGVEILRSAGLDVVFDGDMVIGEYLGLEIARVVSSSEGGEVHVGIGAVDREANRVLHGGVRSEETLDRVIGEVSAHRRPGGEFHPLSQMARERWLMRSLVADPSPLGLGPLVEVPTTEPRQGLRTATPAAAISESSGERVLVMFGAGTDVALVGVAADLVSRENPDRVVITVCSPLFPRLEQALQSLRVPVSVADAPLPWVM